MTAPQPNPASIFRSAHYARHNARRLEHLASLGLPLTYKTVLEPGAGVGDHTLFYLDRGCSVTAMEPRLDNYNEMVATCRRYGARFKHANADTWALEDLSDTFDIVHAYGLLYHLDDPKRALSAMAARCHGLLLLETCVSFGSDLAVNLVDEPADNPSQSVTGRGCRPTRPWLMRELAGLFEHVYVPRAQPSHEEFPNDWSKPWAPNALARAVFVASRRPIRLSTLRSDLPDKQPRQFLPEWQRDDGVRQRAALLKQHAITLIIDVGANIGQYGAALRASHDFQGRIVSFEPLREAFAELKARADADPRWDCRMIALGDRAHEAQIGVSANSVSSSLLKASARALEIEPAIGTVAEQTVEVVPLADILAGSPAPDDNVMVKIDAQGSERAILAGAGDLRRASLIEMECSVFPVYEGEMLIEEAIGTMRERGFEVAAILPGWWDAKSNRCLQFDVLFIRRDR